MIVVTSDLLARHDRAVSRSTSYPTALELDKQRRESNWEREAQHVDRLAADRVRGVVLTALDADRPRIDRLPRQGIGVVLISRDAARVQDCCAVSVDDVEGGRLAVSHLRDLGHERIALVGGPLTARFVADRRAGRRAAALAASGMDEAALVVETTEQRVEDGRRAGERIVGLSRAARPTAVFCANDLI